VKVIDLEREEEEGLKELLNKLDNVLGHVRLIQEKAVLKNYYKLKSSSPDKVTTGPDETIAALESKSLSTIIINEEARIFRILKAQSSETVGAVSVRLFAGSKACYWTEGTPRERSLEDSKQELLIDWVIENFNRYGATLEVVTANSEEGAKFLKECGIGGIKK